jgi:hypothetical protein
MAAMASAKGERLSCHTFKTNRERAKALLSLAASSAKLWMGGSRLLRGGFACFGCPALNFGRKDAWISI